MSPIDILFQPAEKNPFGGWVESAELVYDF